MSLKYVANEIWFEIFQQLEKKDIFSCLLVCKSWYSPAIRACYQDICIKEDKLKYLQQQLTLNDHGYWTHKLTMKAKEDDGLINPDSRLEIQEFLLLLSMLPRLKILNLSSSAYHNYYMGILRDEQDALLPCIEEISSLTYHKPYQELHFSVCYNFSKSIKRLVTFANEYRIHGDKFDFLYYLPHFDQLTELSIYNDRQKDLTIFDILACCKNLTTFKYSSYFQVPMRAEEQEICITNNYLKSIHLNIPTITRSYIQYLIKQSNTLESLVLNIQSTNLYRFLIENQSIISTFSLAVSKLNNLQITCNPKQIPNITPIKMKLYYDFIINLKGNRNLYCDATFAESGSNHIMINICHQQQLLKFTCGMLNNDPSHFIDKYGIINSLKFILNQSHKTLPKNILQYYHYNTNHSNANQLLSIHQPNFSFKAYNKQLSKISLDKFHFSQETIDAIAMNLPHLDSIQFLSPAYQQDQSISLANTCLDLTGFSDLTQFHFDVRNLQLLGRENVYLQFDFGSSSTCDNLCYQIKGEDDLVNHDFIYDHTNNNNSITISIVTFKSSRPLKKLVLVNENKTLIQYNCK